MAGLCAIFFPTAPKYAVFRHLPAESVTRSKSAGCFPPCRSGPSSARTKCRFSERKKARTRRKYPPVSPNLRCVSLNLHGVSLRLPRGNASREPLSRPERRVFVPERSVRLSKFFTKNADSARNRSRRAANTADKVLHDSPQGCKFACAAAMPAVLRPAAPQPGIKKKSLHSRSGRKGGAAGPLRYATSKS